MSVRSARGWRGRSPSHRIGQTAVSFLAEAVADGKFLGGASVWGINAFNRYAHLGISLVPEARGQGYGAEAIQLLVVCYGFRNRNLRRLEVEMLAANTAMRRTAEACGFTHEDPAEARVRRRRLRRHGPLRPAPPATGRRSRPWIRAGPRLRLWCFAADGARSRGCRFDPRPAQLADVVNVVS